jgi:hypothetical protein
MEPIARLTSTRTTTIGEWERSREIDERGALLVRPDQHIAWRSISRPDSPREALKDALCQALAGKPATQEPPLVRN